MLPFCKFYWKGFLYGLQKTWMLIPTQKPSSDNNCLERDMTALKVQINWFINCNSKGWSLGHPAIGYYSNSCVLSVITREHSKIKYINFVYLVLLYQSVFLEPVNEWWRNSNWSQFHGNNTVFIALGLVQWSILSSIFSIVSRSLHHIVLWSV